MKTTAGSMDRMIFKGPFQLNPFCDNSCQILEANCSSVQQELDQENVYCKTRNKMKIFSFKEKESRFLITLTSSVFLASGD